jgi:hypothetical protein
MNEYSARGESRSGTPLPVLTFDETNRTLLLIRDFYVQTPANRFHHATTPPRAGIFTPSSR